MFLVKCRLTFHYREYSTVLIYMSSRLLRLFKSVHIMFAKCLCFVRFTSIIIYMAVVPINKQPMPEISLLWGNDLDHREKVLDKLNHQRNKHVKNIYTSDPAIDPIKPSGPSKYANAKYSHAVAANHPWRNQLYRPKYTEDRIPGTS